MTNDDRDLHEIFAEVRREEEEHVPPISMLSLTARTHRPRRLSGRLAAAAVCLATLILAALWRLPGPRMSPEGADPGRQQAANSITSWKPATDFLLDTPGRELLEGVPDIGEWHGLGPVPDPGGSRQPFKQEILP
jgi:hypothetical protein